jgi:hypothetical protein
LVIAACFFGWPSRSQGDNQLKNVQVLTDLNKEQLEDYMADVVEYLGVKKCTFCHAQEKSSDEKEHKVKARQFMKLTRELNAGFFKDMDKKVTCYTCHRGQEEPVNTPEEAEGKTEEKK